MDNTATYKAQIQTPIEIAIPMVGIQDHGLSLVHDLTGAPRNYLHEVSIGRDEQDAIRFLQSSGYAQRCGWVRPEDKHLMWTYSKPFPLTVGVWAEVMA